MPEDRHVIEAPARVRSPDEPRSAILRSGELIADMSADPLQPFSLGFRDGLLQAPAQGKITAAADGVLEMAVKYQTLIVEDDPYGDLYFGEAPPPSIMSLSQDVPGSREFIAHCGSLSKVLSPGLRIGWMIAPAELLAKATMCKQFSDAHTSTFARLTGANGKLADANVLAKKVIEQLLAFVPGAPSFASIPDVSTLRLSFATANVEKIEEGIARLAVALR